MVTMASWTPALTLLAQEHEVVYLVVEEDTPAFPDYRRVRDACVMPHDRANAVVYRGAVVVIPSREAPLIYLLQHQEHLTSLIEIWTCHVGGRPKKMTTYVDRFWTAYHKGQHKWFRNVLRPQPRCVNGVPFEINAMRNVTARRAATAAYLVESRT